MNIHHNARTTPHSRMVLVQRMQAGACAGEVAASLGVSVRTVYKWLARYRAEGAGGLADRTSRPHRLAQRLSGSLIDLVMRLRREFRMTASRIAQSLRLARSTVAALLRRAGLGKLNWLDPKPPPRRYERQAPGELIHLDTKKLARFWRPGHRVTGDRQGQSRNAGWDFIHVCIDDHSRLAYVETLADERGESTAAFLQRAVAWFAGQGVHVQRVMTDNGSGYKAKLFQAACAALGLRQLYTRPYTPKTNGKAERFIQTLLREWAYSRAYDDSDQRNAHLPVWLHRYNHHRPHASLGAKPPISRLQAPCEQPA